MSSEQEQQQDQSKTEAGTEQKLPDSSLIEQLPDNKQRLHPDSIKVSRISTALVCLIIAIVPTAIAIFSDNFWLMYIGLGLQ